MSSLSLMVFFANIFYQREQLMAYFYSLPTRPKTVKNNPDRKMLLAIAIALNFSVDETQHLLKYAKEPELYPRNTFDSTIIYALERGCSIIETNILLENLNCDLLIFEEK